MTKFLEKILKPLFWQFWVRFAHFLEKTNFLEKLDYVTFKILQLPTTMQKIRSN